MRRPTVWNSGLESPSKYRNPFVTQVRPAIETPDTPSGDSCSLYISEFTANTTLHGLKYIGDEKRPIFERVWWSIMVAISMGCCGHLIFRVWTKWQQSPVIVTFAEHATPVWMVPFPAITICSETKARQTVYNYTAYYYRIRDNDSQLTEEEWKMFDVISLVCDNYAISKGNYIINQSDIEDLFKVAPQVDEMLWACQWRTYSFNCSVYFNPIMLDEGICYTFNMLNAQELFNLDQMYEGYNYPNHEFQSMGWSLDSGYSKNSPIETYPSRGSGSGEKAGMILVLRSLDVDSDYLCKGPVQGFKILLHAPSEFPKVSQQYFRVPLNHEVIISFTPRMMTTSDGLKNYSPMRRKCFFASEKNLKYFKVYTQSNCELECLSNFTMLTCGCVPFYMPRNSSMPICSSEKLECIYNAADDLLISGIKSGILENEMGNGDVEFTEPELVAMTDRERMLEQCECLPACTSISYDAVTSQTDIKWSKVITANKMSSDEISGVNIGRVTLFFRESQFIMSRRSELYGLTDFLANCGGLLGLFLGFSILSVVETIYFFTLRAFCNFRNKVAQRKIRPQYDRP